MNNNSFKVTLGIHRGQCEMKAKRADCMEFYTSFVSLL